VLVPILGAQHFVPAIQRARDAGKLIALASFSHHCAAPLRKEAHHTDVLFLDQVLEGRQHRQVSAAPPEGTADVVQLLQTFLQQEGGAASLRVIGRHLTLHPSCRGLVRRHGGLYRFLRQHDTFRVLSEETLPNGAIDAIVQLNSTASEDAGRGVSGVADGPGWSANPPADRHAWSTESTEDVVADRWDPFSHLETGQPRRLQWRQPLDTRGPMEEAPGMNESTKSTEEGPGMNEAVYKMYEEAQRSSDPAVEQELDDDTWDELMLLASGKRLTSTKLARTADSQDAKVDS